MKQTVLLLQTMVSQRPVICEDERPVTILLTVGFGMVKSQGLEMCQPPQLAQAVSPWELTPVSEDTHT